MAVGTVDVEALLGSDVADLNRAIDTPRVRTEITPDGKVRELVITLEI